MFSRRFASPLVISAAVLAGAAAPLSPLVRVVVADGRPIATLRTSVLYSIFAPISDLLDTITLFSPAQYWATFGLAASVLITIELFRFRTVGLRSRCLGLVRCAARLLGGTVAALGLMLMLPRPMASLSLNDRDLVAVDFHSHTSASHDGRAGFDAERNRAWHASAGFDVAYVTDHQTFAGAVEALRSNPRIAEAGTVILPGIELRNRGDHVLLLGANPLRTIVPTAEFRDARVSAATASMPPMLILSMPGNDRRALIEGSSGTVLGGIEVSDACPRGLAQTSARANVIAALTRQLGVASVSGSDNHGWGRAAAAWSVLRIEGWRSMSPAQLDDAIRGSIHGLGPRAVEVVARRRAQSPSSMIGTAFGGVSAMVVMLRTMTWPDRASWITWTWVVWLLASWRGQRRRDSVGSRFEMRPRLRRPSIGAAALEIA